MEYIVVWSTPCYPHICGVPNNASYLDQCRIHPIHIQVKKTEYLFIFHIVCFKAAYCYSFLYVAGTN